MAIELNIEGLANESKLYALDDVNYTIKTTHSPVCGWTLSIYTKDDELLLTGLSLLSETRNLTWRYHASTPLLPKGDLWVLKKTQEDSPLTFYNFGEGGAWGVFYFTEDEQIELGIDR